MINAFGEHDVFRIYTANYVIVKTRSSRSEVFCKKGVPINFAKFTGKHLCQSLFSNRPQACNFTETETLAQVFSCEFCEISKNTFFHRAPLVAASEKLRGLNTKYSKSEPYKRP